MISSCKRGDSGQENNSKNTKPYLFPLPQRLVWLLPNYHASLSHHRGNQWIERKGGGGRRVSFGEDNSLCETSRESKKKNHHLVGIPLICQHFVRTTAYSMTEAIQFGKDYYHL